MLSGHNDDGCNLADVNIDHSAAYWDRFWTYLRWNKYIIIFGGIGGALIGYLCCAPVCLFLNNMSGNSVLELDALESIYYMLSGVVGGAFGLGIAYCVDKRVHPENKVVFGKGESEIFEDVIGSPHHQLARKGVSLERSLEGRHSNPVDTPVACAGSSIKHSSGDTTNYLRRDLKAEEDLPASEHSSLNNDPSRARQQAVP